MGLCDWIDGKLVEDLKRGTDYKKLQRNNKRLKEHNKQVHFKLEGEKKVSQLLRARLKAIDIKEREE